MMEDVVRPSHYRQGKIEPIDFIVSQDLNFLAGNVVKYLARYRWKGTPLDDLRKAQFYLNRLIEEVEKNPGGSPSVST